MPTSASVAVLRARCTFDGQPERRVVVRVQLNKKYKYVLVPLECIAYGLFAVNLPYLHNRLGITILTEDQICSPSLQKEYRRGASKNQEIGRILFIARERERKQIEKLFFKKAEVITASKLVIIYRQVKNGRCLGLIQ